MDTLEGNVATGMFIKLPIKASQNRKIATHGGIPNCANAKGMPKKKKIEKCEKVNRNNPSFS